MLGVYRVSQKNRSLVLKGLWLKFGKSSGSPQFDLFFEHKKSRIMRSKHLWEYCLWTGLPKHKSWQYCITDIHCHFFWDTLYHQYANVEQRGGLSHKALWDLLLAVKQFIQVTEILLRWWEGIWQVMGHLNICYTVHIHPHIQIRVLVSHVSQNIHKPANILQTSYWRTKFLENFPCKLNQNQN